MLIDFAGGDYDAYRPTWSRNTIDFCGRTGYARTAVDVGVPIVSMVSISAQENQLFPVLPTKIVIQVLAPIDIAAQFGAHPDVDEVDAHVRHVMQRVLDEPAAKRRFPIIG